jgi:hypothetical protein
MGVRPSEAEAEKAGRIKNKIPKQSMRLGSLSCRLI